MPQRPGETTAQLIALLQALKHEPELARLAAAERLGQLGPDEALSVLAQVLEGAPQGDAGFAALATVAAITAPLRGSRWALAVAATAQANGAHHVEALFLEVEPLKDYAAGAAAQADARSTSASLGHQKQRARALKNPADIDRYALSSEPAVIQNLLKNPRLTEEIVVRIAARRPARPEPLLEIWKSARWRTRPRVRLALLQNPYLPPSLGAGLLPLLSRLELERLARESALHPLLREQARHWAVRRRTETPDVSEAVWTLEDD